MIDFNEEARFSVPGPLIAQLGRGQLVRLVIYLPNHDMALGKLLTSGVDGVWLNTPQPTLEDSGTSGMKAALNGVPSLSILDGWWLEGCSEGVTGWAIGDDGYAGHEDRTTSDASSMYATLEQSILPLWRQHRERYVDVMRHSIALNGSFFNSHRVVEARGITARGCPCRHVTVSSS
jgi:starch phosphorylase